MKTLIIVTLLTLITFTSQATEARDDWFKDQCLPAIAKDVDRDISLTHYKQLDVLLNDDYTIIYSVLGTKTTPWGEQSKFKAKYTCRISTNYILIRVNDVTNMDPDLLDILINTRG